MNVMMVNRIYYKNVYLVEKYLNYDEQNNSDKYYSNCHIDDCKYDNSTSLCSGP